MVDREARDDEIEIAESCRKRLFEIVALDADTSIVHETLPRPAQHLLTEVDADTFGVGSGRKNERKRHTVAGTEVEDADDSLGQQLADHRQCIDAVRQRLALT